MAAWQKSAWDLLGRAMRLSYRGDWPARLWRLVPGAARPRLVQHSLPLLPPTPTGERRELRIGFASDLHIGPTTPDQLLERAFSLLAEARPDVLLLGGDYIFVADPDRVALRLAQLVRTVRTPCKLAVLGNHDTDAAPVLIRALEAAGARVLEGQAAVLPAPFDDVEVVAPPAKMIAPRPSQAQSGDASHRATVLRLGLAHSSNPYFELRERGVALLFCGHTHGGQIALPGGRPILSAGRYGRRWPAGLYRGDGGHLFVSRGLGAVQVPIRLFAPPDVALITLCNEH